MITDILSRKKSVTVGYLAQKLFVSEATVRRDLAMLEKSGVLERTHGGAFLPEGGGSENPAVVREKQNVQGKRTIAELAKDFLAHDMTVFIDSSSSAGAVIPFICQCGGISVVTNGIRNCIHLIEGGDTKVYLCGGLVSRYSDAALGIDATRFASRYRADLCIISCGGVTARGMTEASPEQSEIKRQMLKNSKVRLLLCDGSKFEKTFMSELCSFEDIDYILTDITPPPEIEKQAIKAGCEILIG